MQLQYLSLLVQTIISSYYEAHRCVILIDDENLSIQLSSIPFVKIKSTNSSFDESLILHYFGCQGFLINTRNPSKTLEQIESTIRHTLERFNKRRYLIISLDDFQIFQSKELTYISDVLVICNENINEQLTELRVNYNFSLYTHKFIGANQSEWNEIIKLDDWFSHNESFARNANLFPNKLINAHGRPFRIATFTYKPYSVPAFHEGTELQLALTFCDAFNLTPEYVVDEVGEWGEIYDNWTGYGILGNVLNDNGDVGLAALYTWAHEYGFLDLSKPAVRTGITCLTPAPKLAAGWLVPLFSFTYHMWIGVALSFIVSSLALALLAYEQYKREGRNIENRKLDVVADSFMETAAIFLLQSFSLFTTRSTGHARTFLYGCLFIFSLLTASSYSSGLASSMTVPRYTGAILTVQELVDSGIQWGATSVAWIMSIMEAPEYNYRVLVERFVKTDGSRLKQYNNKRFAFSVERLPAGQFAIGDYVTEEGASMLRLMREDIYWEQCVLMTKKSSIWLPQLDEFILKIAQTGIPSVWEYTVATKHLNPKIQRNVAYSAHHLEQDNTPVRLEWQHIQGAFGILIFSLALALLSFLIEISCCKHAHQRKIVVDNDNLKNSVIRAQL